MWTYMLARFTFITKYFEKRNIAKDISITREKIKSIETENRQCESELKKLEKIIIVREYNISCLIIKDGKNNYISSYGAHYLTSVSGWTRMKHIHWTYSKNNNIFSAFRTEMKLVPRK